MAKNESPEKFQYDPVDPYDTPEPESEVEPEPDYCYYCGSEITHGNYAGFVTFNYGTFIICDCFEGSRTT